MRKAICSSTAVMEAVPAISIARIIVRNKRFADVSWLPKSGQLRSVE